MNHNAIIAKAAARLTQLQEAQEYEDSLMNFAEYMWPVVEPAIPFTKGWAIEAVAEHLEAVTFGYVKRLLINVPPGFTKSLMTDVFWPAWEWGPRNMPHLRYVCASYSNYLTERDNMRCRNIVISDQYKTLWGRRFGISNEQFTKIKFANTKTGWKLATSVGGIGVGERGDRFIIDDPNNTMEIESEQVRNTTNMWFREVVPTRLNSPKDSAIIVIMQRLHEDDVSGTILANELGYTHLMIPMEYDSSRHCSTVIGYDIETKEEIVWSDPRTEDGELAWPERYPADEYAKLKKAYTPYAIAGQFQQSPEPRGGSIIKRDFWQLWKEDKYPPFEYIIASLDTAYTAKEENDASALTVWGVFRDEAGNPKLFLMWAWQERLEFFELIQKVIETCTPSPGHTGPSFPVDKLLIEDKASGKSVGQELYRMFRGTGRLAIQMVNPTPYGDKVARVHSIQHLFADQMVFAPDRAYADMVIDQCAVFPKSTRDDLVDSTSQALRYLRDMGFALKREEHRLDVEADMMYHSPSSNGPLYPC